jgi:hypothetical protein
MHASAVSISDRYVLPLWLSRTGWWASGSFAALDRFAAKGQCRGVGADSTNRAAKDSRAATCWRAYPPLQSNDYQSACAPATTVRRRAVRPRPGTAGGRVAQAARGCRASCSTRRQRVPGPRHPRLPARRNSGSGAQTRSATTAHRAPALPALRAQRMLHRPSSRRPPRAVDAGHPEHERRRCREHRQGPRVAEAAQRRLERRAAASAATLRPAGSAVATCASIG